MKNKWDYIDRMDQELNELNDKYRKIWYFQQSDTFKQMPKYDQYLLTKQTKMMWEYKTILLIRLENEIKKMNEANNETT